MESCGPPRVSKKKEDRINYDRCFLFWISLLMSPVISFDTGLFFVIFEIYCGSLLVVKSGECRESHGLSS